MADTTTTNQNGQQQFAGTDDSQTTQTQVTPKPDAQNDEGMVNLRNQYKKVVKDANAYKAELEQIKADREAAEEAKLKENNEFKTLAEKKEEELQSLKAQIARSERRSKLDAALTKAGVNEDAVSLLSDSLVESIEWKEDNSADLEAAINQIKESKPSLFQPVKKTIGDVGVGAQTPAGGLDLEQLKDSGFVNNNFEQVKKEFNL